MWAGGVYTRLLFAGQETSKEVDGEEVEVACAAAAGTVGSVVREAVLG